MNINKNVSIWRGNNTPPSQYHLWLRGDKIYHNNGIEWVENKVDLASLESDGLMSKEDKTKLDEIRAELDDIDEIRAELDDTNKRINSITDSLGKITLITENI